MSSVYNHPFCLAAIRSEFPFQYVFGERERERAAVLFGWDNCFAYVNSMSDCDESPHVYLGIIGEEKIYGEKLCISQPQAGILFGSRV